MHLKVDYLHPRSFPSCSIIGPEEERKTYFERINRRIFSWDLESNLLKNLENLLDIESFPAPMSFEQKTTNECQICYDNQLDMPIPDVLNTDIAEQVLFPDVICPNEHCSRLFHKDCLLEWFRSLPNTRQSFKTWTGECPFCTTVRFNFIINKHISNH